MKYYNIMDITNGDIVQRFDTEEEASEWIDRQENPQMYEIIGID